MEDDERRSAQSSRFEVQGLNFEANWVDTIRMEN